jgi:hypothetical protein
MQVIYNSLKVQYFSINLADGFRAIKDITVAEIPYSSALKSINTPVKKATLACVNK